ncbi:hypothetical protein J4430_03810 [Candidatus Woesearchaeota archaeon]|nr:hypothetical protein [Candidatus Woesearchaeota archaeon]
MRLGLIVTFLFLIPLAYAQSVDIAGQEVPFVLLVPLGFILLGIFFFLVIFLKDHLKSLRTFLSFLKPTLPRRSSHRSSQPLSKDYAQELHLFSKRASSLPLENAFSQLHGLFRDYLIERYHFSPGTTNEEIAMKVSDRKIVALLQSLSEIQYSGSSLSSAKFSSFLSSFHKIINRHIDVKPKSIFSFRSKPKSFPLAGKKKFSGKTINLSFLYSFFPKIFSKIHIPRISFSFRRKTSRQLPKNILQKKSPAKEPKKASRHILRSFFRILYNNRIHHHIKSSFRLPLRRRHSIKKQGQVVSHRVTSSAISRSSRVPSFSLKKGLFSSFNSAIKSCTGVVKKGLHFFSKGFLNCYAILPFSYHKIQSVYAVIPTFFYATHARYFYWRVSWLIDKGFRVAPSSPSKAKEIYFRALAFYTKLTVPSLDPLGVRLLELYDAAEASQLSKSQQRLSVLSRYLDRFEKEAYVLGSAPPVVLIKCREVLEHLTLSSSFRIHQIQDHVRSLSKLVPDLSFKGISGHFSNLPKPSSHLSKVSFSKLFVHTLRNKPQKKRHLRSVSKPHHLFERFFALSHSYGLLSSALQWSRSRLFFRHIPRYFASFSIRRPSLSKLKPTIPSFSFSRFLNSYRAFLHNEEKAFLRHLKRLQGSMHSIKRDSSHSFSEFFSHLEGQLVHRLHGVEQGILYHLHALEREFSRIERKGIDSLSSLHPLEKKVAFRITWSSLSSSEKRIAHHLGELLHLSSQRKQPSIEEHSIPFSSEPIVTIHEDLADPIFSVLTEIHRERQSTLSHMPSIAPLPRKLDSKTFSDDSHIVQQPSLSRQLKALTKEEEVLFQKLIELDSS